MRRGVLITIAAFLAISGSYGQEVRKLSLKECVEIALQNNLTVKRSVLSVENADIAMRQSKFSTLPSLNLGSSGGANWGRSVDPTSNLFVDQQINSFNLNANASLLLFNAFRVMNTIRQTVNDKAAADNDLSKAKNDVILSVVTLYTTVIFNRELLQNAQFQLNTTNQQLDRTRKLEQAGSVPRGNVLDLEAQSATNELNFVQRENSYNLSMLQLKQAMQMPASVVFEVEVPDLNVEEQSITQTTEQVYDLAKQNMPEIKAAVYRTESALFALKAARASYYPSLRLNGSAFTNYSSAFKIVDSFTISDPNPIIGYSGADPNNPANLVRSFRPDGQTVLAEKPFNNQLSDNISRSLQLTLSIPVFNAYQVRANVKRSLVTQEQAQINLTDTENRLRQAIETAYNDATAAAKTYASSQKAVQAREEAFRMTKQRYDAGASNYVDYQVSENNLFQSKSDLVRAKYDFIFKKKVLDFYQGKSIDY